MNTECRAKLWQCDQQQPQLTVLSVNNTLKSLSTNNASFVLQMRGSRALLNLIAGRRRPPRRSTTFNHSPWPAVRRSRRGYRSSGVTLRKQ